MSETARALGIPGELEWGGRTLLVSRVTLGVEARFERWLESRARAAVARQAEALGDALPAALDALDREAEAGGFDWWSPAALQATATRHGHAELTFLCVHAEQPDWTRQRHAELLADSAAAELSAHIRRLSAPWPGWLKPKRGGGAYLTQSEWFAWLTTEHGLRPWEVERLDRWQAQALYNPDRDKEGTIVATGKAPGTEAEDFETRFRRRLQFDCKLPGWMVEAMWAEHCERVGREIKERRARRRSGGH